MASNETMNLYEAAFRLAEKYGFGLLLSTAILYSVRTDVVLPMVQSHQEFLREVARTQQDISKTMAEQTRLLYAIQDRQDVRQSE